MRGPVLRRTTVAITAGVALCSCGARVDSRAAEARAYIRDVTGDHSGTSGRLEISTTGVTTDGRFAKIRGLVKNAYPETIHGVRYVVTIYQEGSPPRVLDRWQEQADTTIDPGQRATMRLDVDSMYFGSLGSRPVNIEAQPVLVGDRPMPPPEGWR